MLDASSFSIHDVHSSNTRPLSITEQKKAALMAKVDTFEPSDFEALKQDDAGGKRDNTDARNKLLALHNAIYPQLRTHNLDLHLMFGDQSVITDHSATTLYAGDSLAVQYSRNRSQARMVERLMGREEAAAVGDISIRRHPIIEMRLSAEAFAIELVLGPDARWDQTNLAGKLSIDRHNHELYNLLSRMDKSYAMGFWRGVHCNDMHLTTGQFYHPQIMDEWLSTFEPGQDWFRLGIWFDPEDERLQDNDFAENVLEHIRALYQVYTMLRWASDNNFHAFYTR